MIVRFECLLAGKMLKYNKIASKTILRILITNERFLRKTEKKTLSEKICWTHEKYSPFIQTEIWIIFIHSVICCDICFEFVPFVSTPKYVMTNNCCICSSGQQLGLWMVANICAAFAFQSIFDCKRTIASNYCGHTLFFFFFFGESELIMLTLRKVMRFIIIKMTNFFFDFSPWRRELSHFWHAFEWERCRDFTDFFFNVLPYYSSKYLVIYFQETPYNYNQFLGTKFGGI